MNTSKTFEREGTADTQLEALIDEHEFSRITGRSVASARRDRLLRQGCPWVKLTGLVRYRPQDVREYIERNLRGGQHGE
jgi:hypothetical protein